MADPLQTELDGARNRARQQQRENEAASPKQASPAPREQDRRSFFSRTKKSQWQIADPNYPIRITTLRWIAFGFIAIGQDLLQLILDLLGVGWIAGYITLPFVWAAYWYIIIRFAPKPVRPKLWRRSAIMSGIEVIPVVGEFTPGWTITFLSAWYLVRLYETGKGGGLVGKALDKVGAAASKAKNPTASKAG